MADKMAEFEERFVRLEEKLRATFAEVDKRLQQQPQFNYEERLQELEDLLLLLQLETAKIKEKTGEGLSFGLAPNSPDVSERVTRLENEIASTNVPVVSIDTDAKIAALTEKVNSLQLPTTVTADNNDNTELAQNVKQLERKVRTLEALLEKRGKEEIETVDGVFADVQKILKR